VRFYLKFALEVAKWTNGIFDPAVGKVLEDHGFNQHYLTGETIQSCSSDSATYRDIVLNERGSYIVFAEAAGD
jgi:thiamine biosynthesis lipoprotein